MAAMICRWPWVRAAMLCCPLAVATSAAAEGVWDPSADAHAQNDFDWPC